MEFTERQSGLLVPTDREANARAAAKEDAEKNAADDERRLLGFTEEQFFWRKYDKQHAACPQCGGPRGAMCVTTGPRVGRDLNSADCGCGWSGICDDLVPASKDEEDASR